MAILWGGGLLTRLTICSLCVLTMFNLVISRFDFWAGFGF